MNVAREKMKNLLLTTEFDGDEAYMIEIPMFDIEIDQIIVSPYFIKMKRPDGSIRYSCNSRMQIMGTHDITQSILYMNVDDVLLKFENMMRYRFVGPHSLTGTRLFISPEEYEELKIKYEYIYILQQKEPDECYVCYENTFGHKTTCGHHICAHCFYKSMKDCEDCDERNTTFECGMCKKMVEFCDECEDDEDKYDEEEDEIEENIQVENNI
jgi:hypothetical protein